VTIWANTSEGSTFDGFTGSLTGTTTPQTLTFDGDESVDAAFNLVQIPPQDVCKKYDIGGDLYEGELPGLSGWTDTWTWGGNYGGGDDGTFRLLMGPGDGCGTGNESAMFIIDTDGAYMDSITLRHLDGIKDDSFKVSITTDANWTEIGSYADGGTNETWMDTTFPITPVKGIVTFKITATGELDEGWCEVWGQVAFSWLKWDGTI
jgi:hypothetical protein